MVVLNNALKAYTSNPYAKFIRESALHASLWRLLPISLLRHMSVIVVKPTASQLFFFKGLFIQKKTRKRISGP